MKFKNNPRTGLSISIILAFIALVILLIANSIPNVDISTLNSMDKLDYSSGIDRGEPPIWKIICYVIVGIFFIISVIVDFVMCRCASCGRHIHSMDIFTMYCPYCSKSLHFDIKK